MAMFAYYFPALFLLVAILIFVVVHLSIIEFILVIFVIVALLFLLPGYLLEFFIDMSGFVAVIKFCYLHTFFMPAVFYFVPIFPESRAGTLVLRFYVVVFFTLS